MDPHYISPTVMQACRSTMPPMSLYKVYYRPALSKLRHELQTTVIDDLHLRGKRKMENASRWATWEGSIMGGRTASEAMRDLVYPTRPIRNRADYAPCQPIHAQTVHTMHHAPSSKFRLSESDQGEGPLHLLCCVLHISLVRNLKMPPVFCSKQEK